LNTSYFSTNVLATDQSLINVTALQSTSRRSGILPQQLGADSWREQPNSPALWAGEHETAAREAAFHEALESKEERNNMG
jgi:hypothetical protein